MNGLKLDSLDAKILYRLDQQAKSEKVVPAAVTAKLVFDTKNSYELRSKESLLRVRLEKLLSYGLLILSEEKDGRIYGINSGTVMVRKGELVLKVERDGAVKIGSGTFVICQAKEGTQCFQVA